MPEQTMWALGWLSHGSQQFPAIAEKGAWKIFPTRKAAVDAREDPRQDLRLVRVTIAVIDPKSRKRRDTDHV